eukprot:CAMPEP_0206615896 /NCGR_PEP_ID=MMETSP0325_2-20121206/58606_1 /ASSEMBLY_ACC=CAM_ASM_000347 /TAXON_ID=2866 /ORGANISM="Crypthecodinium cohnii, Strain Seligo" /LENGTH=180 /DNA_ID=CAMNT_0054137363 /DNA_START=424 /DNA_END=967 /DNA_ORIENTATION=-
MATKGKCGGLLHCFRGIHALGLARSYSGFPMAVAVTVPSIAISFGVYGAAMDRCPDSWNLLTKSTVAGGASGLVASTVTYPVDVLRKRLQVMGVRDDLAHRTWKAEAIHIMEAEGPRGFFRGLGPELVKVLPTVAVTFTVFETLQAAGSDDTEHRALNNDHVAGGKVAAEEVGSLIALRL